MHYSLIPVLVGQKVSYLCHCSHGTYSDMPLASEYLAALQQTSSILEPTEQKHEKVEHNMVDY